MLVTRALVIISITAVSRAKNNDGKELMKNYRGVKRGKGPASPVRQLFSCGSDQVEFSVHFGSVSGLDCEDNWLTGKPDPYVIASIGGASQTTGYCDGCTSWDQWLNFGCVSISEGTLSLIIKDKDGGINGADDGCFAVSDSSWKSSGGTTLSNGGSTITFSKSVVFPPVPPPVPAPVSPPVSHSSSAPTSPTSSPAPNPTPFPIPSTAPTSPPSKTDTVSVKVYFAVEAASNYDPNSARDIKDVVAAQVGLSASDLKGFQVESSEVALAVRTRRLASYAWAVSFEAVTSLSSTTASDGASFAAIMNSGISSSNFSASLGASLGFAVVVSSVTTAMVTRAPSMYPTLFRAASSDPAMSDDDGSKKTSSASSGVMVSVFGALGGVFVLAASAFYSQKRSMRSKKVSRGTQPSDNYQPSWLHASALAQDYDLDSAVQSKIDEADNSRELELTEAQISGPNTEGNLELSLQRRKSRQSGAAEESSKDVNEIPYQLISLDPTPFASGKCGGIFRGEYLGQAVAAKRMLDAQPFQTADDLRDELGMLVQLSHPCILRVYGTTTMGSGRCMVVDLCEGGSLGARRRHQRA